VVFVDWHSNKHCIRYYGGGKLHFFHPAVILNYLFLQEEIQRLARHFVTGFFSALSTGQLTAYISLAVGGEIPSFISIITEPTTLVIDLFLAAGSAADLEKCQVGYVY
jgi:hypothetical protein